MSKEITRIRHENARKRTLSVAEKRLLAPGYLAIRFDCADFQGFASLSEDDHIKLFFDGEPGANGKPPMRDYTPRRWDAATCSFEIEFALHEDAGPATAWANASKPGDKIEIGGPRGSMVVGDGYDWYWLIADEAGLPAVGRFLETRAGAHIYAVVAVTGEAEQIALALSPTHQLHWVHRPASAAAEPAALIEAVAQMPFPPGDGFIWIAAEAGVAKVLREHVEGRGHPSAHLKAKGYWVQGGTLD